MDSNLLNKTIDILNECNDFEEESALKIIDEVKKNSANYGEVENKLRDLVRDLFHLSLNREKYQHIIKMVFKNLNKEKNDLPVTNRSSHL